MWGGGLYLERLYGQKLSAYSEFHYFSSRPAAKELLKHEFLQTLAGSQVFVFCICILYLFCVSNVECETALADSGDFSPTFLLGDFRKIQKLLTKLLIEVIKRQIH